MFYECVLKFQNPIKENKCWWKNNKVRVLKPFKRIEKEYQNLCIYLFYYE